MIFLVELFIEEFCFDLLDSQEKGAIKTAKKAEQTSRNNSRTGQFFPAGCLVASSNINLSRAANARPRKSPLPI